MKNAIFCGGSSMLKGLEDRIHKELSRYGEELYINFDWQRRYSSWIGGSMIGSLSTFQNLAIAPKDTGSGSMSDSDIIRRIFWLFDCGWYLPPYKCSILKWVLTLHIFIWW